MSSDALYDPAVPIHPEPNTVSLSTGAGGIVFSASAGTTPTTDATSIGVGATAFNEATNEEWFVNSSLEWQQIIAV